MTRIGSGAARAGAVVPKPLESVAVGSFEFMLESRVEGRILAPHIARHPSRLRPELRRVCSWLEEWSRLSATSIGLERSLIECEVLDPARKVAPLLEDGDRYLHRLEARCERLIGAEAPLTPSHNDLSMWNVLIDGRSLCIIDWESAEGAGLPLKDFFYAVGDAVWSTGRYASRRDAVQSAFADGGPEASFVAALRARLSAAVGVTEAVLELSEHACWLKHAAYEIRKHPGDATPFRDIVRWLAGELTEGEADT